MMLLGSQPAGINSIPSGLACKKLLSHGQATLGSKACSAHDMPCLLLFATLADVQGHSHAGRDPHCTPP